MRYDLVRHDFTLCLRCGGVCIVMIVGVYCQTYDHNVSRSVLKMYKFASFNISALYSQEVETMYHFN